MRQNFLILFFLLFFLSLPSDSWAQELDATVTLNTQAVQGTSTAVFDNLKQVLTDFINERRWTHLRFRRNERIRCTFYFNVKKYDEADHKFETALSVSATRPVYNATYTTTIFSTRDANCNFRFQEFDKLDFRPESVDNDLTAIIAYYAYLIIGIDLDTMSPLGGTDPLQQAQTIATNAQGLLLSAKGWKAFDDAKNRQAIISDYLDGAMEPFRQMQYKYYREGLDRMAENSERGRANITDAFDLLAKAHENKSLSQLPQLFTEYKADEIVNIYSGHATQQEKDRIVDLLSRLNASKNPSWHRIRSGR